MQAQFFLYRSPRMDSCVSPLSSASLMMTMALKSVLLCPTHAGEEEPLGWRG